jgi:hypothetical protein
VPVCFETAPGLDFVKGSLDCYEGKVFGRQILRIAAIWAIADHPRGKDLLLNTDRTGYHELKNQEAMDRFYDGKAKSKDKPQGA